MSPCRASVKVVWRLRSQASRLAAARMLLRAFAVGVRGPAAGPALARRRRITCQVAYACTSFLSSAGSIAGEQPLEPLLGSRQVLVALRQCAGGGEHVPQVVGRVAARAGIKGFVGERQPAGGHVGEQAAPAPCRSQFSAREAGGRR